MHTYTNMLLIVVLVLVQFASGERLKRMTQGYDAELGDFPYTVFIRTRHLYCSGTIISKNWILTAAHCIDTKVSPEDHYILTGILSFYSEPFPESVQIRTGKKVITHPDYQLFNATNFTDIGSFNDMGLIKTNQSFEFNKYVNRAKLSAMSGFGMHSCKAVGFGDSEWGKDHSLRYLNVREIVRCKEVEDSEFRNLYPNDLYLCSYPENAASQVLGGDSGGPLVCPGDILVGVCFWGKQQEDTFIMTHTSVAGFISWISSAINSKQKSGYKPSFHKL